MTHSKTKKPKLQKGNGMERVSRGYKRKITARLVQRAAKMRA